MFFCQILCTLVKIITASLQQLNQMNSPAIFSDAQLIAILSQSKDAIAVYATENILIQMATDAMLAFWGKDESIIGLPLIEAVPELEDQPFIGLLQNVFKTGITNSGKAVPAKLLIDGQLQTSYYDYEYRAIKNEAGETYAIMHTAADVTSQEMNRQETEGRLRYMLDDVPIAIAVLTSRNLIIESANNKILEVWGKKKDAIGKTLLDAIPELEGQEFLQILDNVFTSGKPYYGNEVKALLEQNGKVEEVYSNFVYQPFKDHNGEVRSIILVANVVTEQVVSRKKIEQAEEGLRMAIEAAELGSYHINVIDRIFVSSPRLKEFFGFGPDEEVPYEAAINQIHPDYRQAAADLVEAAITTGIRFDMEYPVIGHNDGKIRWVRGIRTVQQDADGINRFFTGVLHEITERKQDEIRKNDFIGMVSHELKTPLTSLMGLIQLSGIKLKDHEDVFLREAMDKALLQVKRMTNMINGFLNVSRLESGKIHLEKTRFEIDKLVKEIANDLRLIVKHHQFVIDTCEHVFVNADRDKIGSVINNFLTNAVKYSPENLPIAINCHLKDNYVEISVKDQGLGISLQDQEKIFERFYRVENKDTKQIAGFGIGLYLSAEIIHRHEGKIWVDSKLNEGATFYFTIPVDYVKSR